MFRLGPGLAMTMIKGAGGSKTLRNGSSSESFPIPDGTSTARNLIIDLGVSIRPEAFDQFSFGLDTFVYNVEASENRAFSYLISLHWHYNPNEPSVKKGRRQSILKRPKKIRRKKSRKKRKKKSRTKSRKKKVEEEDPWLEE